MQLTLEEVRELLCKSDGAPAIVTNLEETHDTAIEVGKCYFIRGITMYYTGRVIDITVSDIVLEDAAWIASTGRFSDFLKTGCAEEVEPFQDAVIVSRRSIVDVTPWMHDLPRTKK
jgi:hypothetical protein